MSYNYKQLALPPHLHELVTELAKTEGRHKYAIVERAIALYKQQSELGSESALK